MAVQIQNLNPQISNPPSEPQTSSITQARCALCGLPATRHLTETFNGELLAFCCYGCRHIYEVVGPELAKGVDLRQAIGRAGLDLNAPCCRGAIHGDPAKEAARLLSRLMLNAFLAMMVMALSLALYSDFFFTSWGQLGQGTRSMLQAIAMLFATPAVLLLALPILEDAIFTFQVYRRLTTSALIAIGSLAAYGLSVYASFIGQGQVYFDTATMTLLLVTLGRWLDAKTQVESAQALDELLARAPAEASLITPSLAPSPSKGEGWGGAETRVPVDQLQVGDRIRVRPGENFAVDGRVISGEGSVDEASITGEAAPAYKGPGQTVYAGTSNLDGSFVVETTQVGEERVMGKLVRLLDEARLYRAPIERLADRVAGYFVPLVIVLGLATFGYWTWQASFEQGLMNGLAVLLIACPCALGVSTPLAIWAGLGRAARQGVLIRDSVTLEKLARIRRVFFDKTGTLTTGQSTLAEIVVRRPGDGDERPGKMFPAVVSSQQSAANSVELLQIAASLEHGSEHPLARSIQAAAATQNLLLLPVENFRAMPGLGVSGTVAGQTVWVGSWRLVEQQGLLLPADLRAERQRLEQRGVTVIHVGWDGLVQGLLGLAETIRPAAAPALAEMKRQQLEVRVLTGDSAAAGTALARQLGVPVQSELLPHDKVKLIEQSEAAGPVAMVGDGLNDAPALARASVGVALGCGADVTREAADVSLLGTDLAQITWTLALAQRVYRTIGWTLTQAFAYNVIGIGLAMAGFLHPVLAAAAMVVSSLVVVGNSLRIFRF
ncbi:MAG: heavy metal translocating P-type ATPase [Anaerolineales bacterium]|nr:heavy metal translocating P-type ATPase [Anaerolineales bacterium]